MEIEMRDEKHVHVENAIKNMQEKARTENKRDINENTEEQNCSEKDQLTVDFSGKNKNEFCKQIQIKDCVKYDQTESDKAAIKCEPTPIRKVDMLSHDVSIKNVEENLKDQSIQKGLKNLTMSPEYEEPDLKDMGLLKQCQHMVKGRQHPVFQPVTDEEVEKSMSKSLSIICKVKKLGRAEQLIFSESRLDECEAERYLKEDGVDRILQCTIVKDKNNRQKYICQVLPQKNESKQAKQQFSKEECLKEKNLKIKVISNKLVCHKCPASDGSENQEMVCSVATVEEIKQRKTARKGSN